MSELNLSEIINETVAELESSQLDNPDTVEQDEDLVDLELDEEVSVETEDDESEIEEEQEGEEDVADDDDVESADDAENDVYVVKVDGDDVEVSLDELKAGYSRQSHFTRSMQALKEEREAFETEIEQYNGAITQITALDEAWESNPISVLTSLLGSVENPSYALGLLIKEAASNDLLTPEALEYFGIDAKTKEAWSTETEIERLRRQVREREEAEQTRLKQVEESASETRVQEAMAVFEQQITEIIADEEIDLPTIQDRAKFKADVLRYARDNSILDLRKAYAAMIYEQRKAERAAAPRRQAAQQKKAATKVVSRGGAGQSGVSTVNNPKDLRSVIENTMKELEF
jgi:hypothetical protein